MQMHKQFCLYHWQTSAVRDTLVSVLESSGFNSIELLLTPQQYGIPNSRSRYYLLAKARPLFFVHAPSGASCGRAWRHIPTGETPTTIPVARIENYLDPDQPPWEDHPCRVPDRILTKWGRLFDIVRPDSCGSCCFTRGEACADHRSTKLQLVVDDFPGYTRMVERTGSILQMNDKLDVSNRLNVWNLIIDLRQIRMQTTAVFDEFLAAQSDPSRSTAASIILHPLKLRYFSTTELLRIFHVSHSSASPYASQSSSSTFTWPRFVTEKTRYRLIGNSVNVEVVRRLIDYLFAADDLCGMR